MGIAAALFTSSTAQLVVYPNGAVAPFDPNNAAATKEHFAALNEAGAAVNPYFTHAQDLAVAAPVTYAGLPIAGIYGRKKRSADPQVLGADGLVTYPNGAVAPFDPNVAIATANHYAAKIAHGSYFPYAGALGVHPAAAVYGRKKREAQLPVNLITGYSHVGYPYYGYGVAPVVAPFVAHPNGALVPAEPKEVVDARAEHLAAHAVEKREAQIPVGLVTGYSAVHAGYPFHYGYGVAPVVSPFVAHPNGALVPAEP